VLRAEGIAAQTGDGRGINELGEDHRHSFLPTRLDQSRQDGNDYPSGRNLKRRCVIEEASLHIDHEQRGLFRPQDVKLVDSRLPGAKQLFDGGQGKPPLLTKGRELPPQNSRKLVFDPGL
jgi:hypothetical protein